MATIVQKDDPILRKTALPVDITNIGTPAFATLLKDMKKALDSQEDGVAIAAPQIGVSKRIFIVSGKPFKSKSIVCINPEIVKLSKEKKWSPEGCLSIRYLYGKTKRHTRATVTAYDENGKQFTRGASGLLAQIFQHEVDHLNGILFIDTAKEVEDIPPEKRNKDNNQQDND